MVTDTLSVPGTESFSVPFASYLCSQMKLNLLLPSPINSIVCKFPNGLNFHLFIKRDDLIHDFISGNKWRKLKYNFKDFKVSGKKRIASFGGAFSNHLVALATLCHHHKIPLDAYLRGEEDIHNPTLIYLRNLGVNLHFISRSDYKRRSENEFQSELVKKRDTYLIPEGGANHLSLRGVKEMVEELNEQVNSFDLIACPIGSGGTFAGISSAIGINTKLLGIAATNDTSLKSKIETLLGYNLNLNHNINYDYTFGGFARWNEPLIQFMNDFYRLNGIRLDPIYTGKMMIGIQDLLTTNKISSDSKIVVVHTGGLQGNQGFNYRFGQRLD